MEAERSAGRAGGDGDASLARCGPTHSAQVELLLLPIRFASVRAELRSFLERGRCEFDAIAGHRILAFVALGRRLLPLGIRGWVGSGSGLPQSTRSAVLFVNLARISPPILPPLRFSYRNTVLPSADFCSFAREFLIYTGSVAAIFLPVCNFAAKIQV